MLPVTDEFPEKQRGSNTWVIKETGLTRERRWAESHHWGGGWDCRMLEQERPSRVGCIGACGPGLYIPPSHSQSLASGSSGKDKASSMGIAFWYQAASRKDWHPHSQQLGNESFIPWCVWRPGCSAPAPTAVNCSKSSGSHFLTVLL